MRTALLLPFLAAACAAACTTTPRTDGVRVSGVAAERVSLDVDGVDLRIVVRVANDGAAAFARPAAAVALSFGDRRFALHDVTSPDDLPPGGTTELVVPLRVDVKDLPLAVLPTGRSGEVAYRVDGSVTSESSPARLPFRVDGRFPAVRAPVVSGVRLGEPQAVGDTLVFAVALRLANQNPFDVDLAGVRYTLSADGRSLGALTVGEGVALPANGARDLALSATFPAGLGLQGLASGGTTLRVALAGSLGTPFGDVPFRE